jgi:hypothetical protein
VRFRVCGFLSDKRAAQLTYLQVGIIIWPRF